MNKLRRKELGEVINGLMSMQDKDDLRGWIRTLDCLKDEEEDYFGNIPENLQYSRRAEKSEEAIEILDDALDVLNEFYDKDEFDKDDELIQKAIDKIEEARW